MTIELEKILTISARDYCDMNGAKLYCYKAIGVHVESSSTNELVGVLANKVPENTEVVVEYRFSINRSTLNTPERYASGTALIPEKKSFGFY